VILAVKDILRKPRKAISISVIEMHCLIAALLVILCLWIMGNSVGMKFAG